MRIVVLDGYTLNPGDLSWAELETLAPTTIYDRTTPDETVARSTDCDIILTNKTELSRQTLQQLPRLRYLGVLATGCNVVDLDAARQQGVPVTNVPDYGAPSVTQMVFAHLLSFTQQVAYHARTVADGRWSRQEDFCYWDYPLVELAGLTMGIVGFGRIGRATATVAQAFGMEVVVHDPNPPSDLPVGIRSVGLDDLFRQSDVVSLHCPLTPATEKIVGAQRLRLMKPTAYLINTARGQLIDEAALAEALAAGQIAGAGLDVLSIEPPPPNHPLLTATNCCVTPHIAWATAAARKRLLDTAVANVRAFLAGKPQNVVNAE